MQSGYWEEKIKSRKWWKRRGDTEHLCMPHTDRVSKTLTQFPISLILMACCSDTLTILIAPLFKASFEFSYRHLWGVKGKLDAKSPSKKHPGAEKLQSWNSFSGGRQQFYYSLKCSALAFLRVWRSRLRRGSEKWAAWPWAHCVLSLSISTTLSLNNGQTSSLPPEANGFSWRRNQHRNTSTGNPPL